MTDEQQSRLGRAIDLYNKRIATSDGLLAFHKHRDDHANRRGRGNASWLYTGLTLYQKHGSHGEYTLRFDGGYVLDEDGASALAGALSKYITQAALEASESVRTDAMALRSEVIRDALNIVSELENAK